MRESVGSTMSLQVIILFILIFSAFLILVINYSRAYMVKNEMLTIIEKYDGISDNSDAIKITNNYLKEKGYKTKGYCPSSWYGATELEGSRESIELAKDNKRYYYCFNEICHKDHDSDFYDSCYTKMKVFYKFNLPILGDFKTFDVDGRTNVYLRR